jgi:DNA-binding response OmpR family regulator
MDGLTCTSTIRSWETSGLLVGHVPIIAVTANARSEQIATLLAAGMDDVVSKPFRILELIPKIEELAARYPRAVVEEEVPEIVVPVRQKSFEESSRSHEGREETIDLW